MATVKKAKPKSERYEESGTIVVINRKGTGFKISDEGDWYNAFKKEQLNGAEVGDSITFEFEDSEVGGSTFHNVKGDVTIDAQGEQAQEKESTGGSAKTGQAPVGKNEPKAKYTGSGNFVTPMFPVPEDHPNRAFARQNALTAAVALLGLDATAAGAEREDLADAALEIAAKFETYLAGV